MMSEFRVNDDGQVVSIWDDLVGVGMEFRRWDGEHQVRWRFRTTKDSIFKEWGVVRQALDRIVGFARERYPQEFGHLVEGSMI